MNTLKYFVWLLMVSATWAAEPIKSYYIVLSPHYDAASREVATTAAEEIILTAPLGSRLHYIDGWNLVTIAEIDLPPKLPMDSVISRRHAVRGNLRPLLAFFERSSGGGQPSSIAGSAAIDFPRTLQLIGPAAPGEVRSVIVLASPLYLSPAEPQFSFSPDRFPSDGHLFVEGANSVFSIVQERQRLKNTKVFFFYPNEHIFSTDLYRDRVARFFSLYCAYQGGVLASFQATGQAIDPAVFDAGRGALRHDQIDPTLGKVEMLSVNRVIPFRQITIKPPEVRFAAESQNATERPAPSTEQEILIDLSRTPDTKTAVGIMWNISGLDLDLYCWQRPDVPAGPLYYHNTRTPEGIYVHDYTDRNDGIAYEKVILDVPPEPLEAMRIFVNFYGGNSGQAVGGKVFVRHKGKTYTGTFSLAAREGNGGANIDDRAHDPHWTEILMGKLTPTDAPIADDKE